MPRWLIQGVFPLTGSTPGQPLHRMNQLLKTTCEWPLQLLKPNFSHHTPCSQWVTIRPKIHCEGVIVLRVEASPSLLAWSIKSALCIIYRVSYLQAKVKSLVSFPFFLNHRNASDLFIYISYTYKTHTEGNLIRRCVLVWHCLAHAEYTDITLCPRPTPCLILYCTPLWPRASESFGPEQVDPESIIIIIYLSFFFCFNVY